jgi:ribonuclease-3
VKTNQTDQQNPFASASAFQAQTGLTFQNQSLILRALTHRSSVNELPFLNGDNERLEFLGDAVIGLVAAEFLYQRFPEKREGSLTAMRAYLVRKETLARFAREIDLGGHLLMGRGEADSGGRGRDSTLSSAFEAVVGALYLDQGMEAAEAFLLPFFRPELERLQTDQLTKDAKSRLQEWSQAELKTTPSYVTVSTTGPDHDRVFTIEVRIGGKTYGTGTGKSKQLAPQAAAQDALEQQRAEIRTS